VGKVKRFFAYFATMLIVFAVTDFCLGGSLLRREKYGPEDISAGSGSAESAGMSYAGPGETEELSTKELGIFIASESCRFVRAAFNRDKDTITGMLSSNTEYITSANNSSYIRYTEKDLHVEGYMATDRKLVQVRQSWYVVENDGTITSGVEVEIEGEETCQTWYIHYRKYKDTWKIFMLENGI